MKNLKLFSIIVLSALITISCAKPTLKSAYKNDFLIGVAINTDISSEKDLQSAEIVKQHFSSVVAENCMKSGLIQPAEGQFFWDDADRFVQFGVDNKMAIIGHCLVWHSQAPNWFFSDSIHNGVLQRVLVDSLIKANAPREVFNELLKDYDVSRDVLIERMKTHIYTIMSRYKGKIKGYDVVNEAVNDDGTLRNSKFLQIIGEDYLTLAYKFAHEADPNAELYYNDYSMAIPTKRDGVVRLIKNLQNEGIKITAIGMQGHIGLDYPEFEEFEKSLVAFTDLGCKVNITEFDINVLPTKQNFGADVSASLEYQQELNPYTEALPDSVYQKLENRYLQFFGLFKKYADKIDRVTLWGVDDGSSWLNDYPVRGRTNYPLLFDRNHQAKPIVDKLIKL
ncbi:MAG: endo-1,4-beta-xylanase [Paludibacter sp.]|jgi:endo-1,4-beta-xylanase|nr:endo-1,4-beta-xylanase [Paludibacter sp.]